MERSPKRSAADLIVELAMDRYDLARAEDGEPFAIDRAGPNVAHKFRGGRASLRATLAARFAEAFGKVPRAQALIDALAVLEGRALAQSKQTLALRTARLSRSRWVGMDGWHSPLAAPTRV